jgi:hypothetical protein
MNSGPSKIAEAIVAILLPPACRDEVLGDLHERYQSRFQYAADACRTISMVIASRIRRTADPQILVIQGFAAFISFLGAAWLRDPAVFRDEWLMLRLAIPAAATVLGLILNDSYSTPGPRSPLSLARGPLIGFALSFVSEEPLQVSNSGLALPPWVISDGCAMSLLLTSMVRMLFPPATDQLPGLNAPALWLKQAEGSGRSLRITALVIVAIFAAERPRRWAGMAAPLLILLVVYQISKRG